MTEALDATFANVTTTDAEDRRRYWRLDAPPPERLQPRQETTIEALEIAARSAHDQARLRHARALEDLRDGLLARLTPRDAARSEADAVAVLTDLGQVMRPGPTVSLRPEVTDAVIDTMRGPFRLRVTCGSVDAAPRVIEPHGLLLGHCSYLVVQQHFGSDHLAVLATLCNEMTGAQQVPDLWADDIAEAEASFRAARDLQ